MKNQRRRKALYVNRREELYPERLLQKEYAPAGKKTRPAKAAPKRRPRAGSPPGR